MESEEQRYNGFFTYKVDSKYRVSIQPTWRSEPGERLYIMSSRELEIPVLKVLTRQAYDYRVGVIYKSDKTPKEKSKAVEKLALLCRTASLSDQGKLLIPKELSEVAGIVPESDVMVAGRGMHFEVWSKPNFERYFAVMAGNGDDDDLGIY